MIGRIAEVLATGLEIPLERPFTIAVGTMARLANVLVRIVLDDGTVGLGECAPFPELTGETQGTVRAAIEAARPLWLGQPAGDYRRLSAVLAGAIGTQTAARAGLEVALFDAMTQRMGVPLHAFLGGAGLELETDLTIPIVDAGEAAHLAREAVARGIRIIKTKVGRDVDADVARVLAIHDAAPDVRFVLDANQGFRPKEAIAFIERLARGGVEPVLFEQPVDRHDLSGLRTVRERVRVPVAADESVATRHDALAVLCAGAADVVNLKLMKCGGIVEALDIVAVCRAGHMGLMIGGMIESRVGMNAAAHLAAGLGGFAHVDLDTHMLLTEDPFSGGFRQEGARLILEPTVAGAGVRPARAAASCST